MDSQELKEKMEFICQELPDLEHDILLKIRDVVVQSNPNAIKESSDGIRIILESLDESVLLTIHNFINKQLN